jgi:hypothetical protein
MTEDEDKEARRARKKKKRAEKKARREAEQVKEIELPPSPVSAPTKVVALQS